MPSMIRSTIALLDHMLSLNEALFERELYDDSEREEISQALNAMRMRVEGYLATSIALETRINGIFKLVRDRGQSVDFQVVEWTSHRTVQRVIHSAGQPRI